MSSTRQETVSDADAWQRVSRRYGGDRGDKQQEGEERRAETVSAATELSLGEI